MFKSLWASLVLLVAATLSFGGVEIVQEDSVDITGTFSVDVVTNYFDNGILQENAGILVQPALEFNIALPFDDGLLANTSAVVGTWHSIHTDRTGSTHDSVAPWYEADVYVGLEKGLGDFTAGAFVERVTSPSEAFQDYTEFNFALAYDDSQWWGEPILPGFNGLQPSANVTVEAGGSVDGFDARTLLILGIEPGVNIVASETQPVNLYVPVSAGIDLNDYYQSFDGESTSGLGYVEAGLKLQTVLPFLNNATIHAGPYLVYFVNDARDLSSDDYEVIGKFGIEIPF